MDELKSDLRYYQRKVEEMNDLLNKYKKEEDEAEILLGKLNALARRLAESEANGRKRLFSMLTSFLAGLRERSLENMRNAISGPEYRQAIDGAQSGVERARSQLRKIQEAIEEARKKKNEYLRLADQCRWKISQMEAEADQE